MKTEVKNTKRFWRRGNVLDLAVLLLLLAAAVSIGYRYYQTNIAKEDQALQTAQVSFVAEDMLPGVADALARDNVLYLENTGEVFGTLLAHPQASDGCPVVRKAASTVMQDESGSFVVALMPEGTLVDLEGVARCQGTQNEEGTFLLDGRYILVPGQRVRLYTEKVSMIVTVTDIRMSSPQ